MTPEGPCNWDYLACDPCEALDGLTPDQQAELVAWASFDLWAATGRLFGPCPRSVLPCGDPWVICGSCWNTLRQCGCRRVPEIRLDGPVNAVTEVVIDGVIIPDTDYRIDDYEWLVRLDGGRWPTNADPLDPDGFRVDYDLGTPPPAGAGLVTGTLVCERAKAICNDDSCRLPRRARQITRQGVRVEWDPNDGFGLPEVDDWVRNVKSPILAGAVHSPDIPHIRRITWEAGSP